MAFINIVRFCESPLSLISRYVFGNGSYPIEVCIRTPLGKQKLTLYCYADMLTFVECFGKQDYVAKKNVRCVVDFGSNIGISALYFLTRNSQAQVYLFEPFPQNIERLSKNLEGFEKRYFFEPVAVGMKNGTAMFGCEPTGRYGGLTGGEYSGKLKIKKIHDEIEVRVREANEILGEILDKYHEIDILKIDVEGIEEELLQSLNPELLKNILHIYVETNWNGELTGFKKNFYGGIARFKREK